MPVSKIKLILNSNDYSGLGLGLVINHHSQVLCWKTVLKVGFTYSLFLWLFVCLGEIRKLSHTAFHCMSVFTLAFLVLACMAITIGFMFVVECFSVSHCIAFIDYKQHQDNTFLFGRPLAELMQKTWTSSSISTFQRITRRICIALDELVDLVRSVYYCLLLFSIIETRPICRRHGFFLKFSWQHFIFSIYVSAASLVQNLFP